MPAGGARPGAGRPPNLTLQLSRNRRLAEHLKDEVNATLAELAPKYAQLVRKAVQLALEGDKAMLKLLIEYPTKFIDTREEPHTGLDMLRAKMAEEGLIASGTSTEGPDKSAAEDAGD